MKRWVISLILAGSLLIPSAIHAENVSAPDIAVSKPVIDKYEYLEQKKAAGNLDTDVINEYLVFDSNSEDDGVEESSESDSNSEDVVVEESSESDFNSEDAGTEEASESVSEPGEELTNYTLMVYMFGSTLEEPGATIESSNAFASFDIVEMAASGFDIEKMNLVLYAGGAKNWLLDEIPDEASGTFVIKKDSLIPVKHDGQAYNMGDSDTLKDFLQFSYEQYPAENYALIIWDHGGGAMQGLCHDALFNDMLEMDELDEALKGSPFGAKKLNWIGFDACLMATAEVAGVVSPYADYMIGSEESEPSVGWNYSFLNMLETEKDPANIGKAIVDNYIGFFEMHDPYNTLGLGATLSCIDLSEYDSLISSIDTYFSDVKVESLEKFAEISRARQGMTSFGRDEANPEANYDLVDLGNMVEKLSESESSDAAEELQEGVSKTVVYTDSLVDGCTGLSVYFPFYNRLAITVWLDLYGTLPFSKEYTAFINQYASGITTNGTVFSSNYIEDIWGNLITDTPQNVRDTRSVFVINLTEDQSMRFGQAQIIALQKGNEDTWHFVAAQEAESVDESTIAGYYVHTNLFFTDESGAPVMDIPLSYVRRDDGLYTVPAILVNDRGERVDARLICERDPSTDSVTVSNVYLYDAAVDSYSQRLSDSIEHYSQLIYQVIDRTPTYSEDGTTLLPFDEWDIAETKEYSVNLDEPWQLSFVTDHLDTESLVVSFEITDIFNNKYMSSLRPLDEIPDAESDLILKYDDDYILIDETTLTLTDLMDETGKRFSAQFTNCQKEEVIIVIDHLAVNGTECSFEPVEIGGTGENGGILSGETQNLTVKIPLEGGETELEATFGLTYYNASDQEVIATDTVEIRGNLN